MNDNNKFFQNFFHLASLTNIYRLFIVIIAIWFLKIIWPFISNVVLMLVFAFLFTTVLLAGVDALERKIHNRGLSVLAVVVVILGGIGTFVGSFISQMSQPVSYTHLTLPTNREV